MAKRDGLDALNGISTSKAEDFFIDVRKLELSLEVLTDWFAMFGFAETGVGSASTIIRNITRQAKVLKHMCDSESRKSGLTQNFKDAANGFFKEFAATVRASNAGRASKRSRPSNAHPRSGWSCTARCRSASNSETRLTTRGRNTKPHACHAYGMCVTCTIS